MVSLGIDWPFASLMALRKRGLPVVSPPPIRAATVSSLMSLVKSLPRFASAAPFLCLIVAHFEWPLMREKPPWGKRRKYANRAALRGQPARLLLPRIGALGPFESRRP